MQALKKRLDQSNEAYDSAFNKLQTGRGNLITSTEKLKKLGAKVSKSIPEELVDFSEQLPNTKDDEPQ